MTRKDEAVSLFWRGLSPAQIATQMDVSVKAVMTYLYECVVQGDLLQSSILFAIGGETKQAVETLEQADPDLEPSQLRRKLRKEFPGVNADEALHCRALTHQETYLGDMFKILYLLESTLHLYVRAVLVEAYDKDWWRKGVPENIRAECASTMERDPEPAGEPFSYTTLIHIKEIVGHQWALFSKLLAKGPASDRPRLLRGLTKLNQIRNRVMHASKGIVPTESDFLEVMEFLKFIDTSRWKTKAESPLMATRFLGPIQ